MPICHIVVVLPMRLSSLVALKLLILVVVLAIQKRVLVSELLVSSFIRMRCEKGAPSNACVSNIVFSRRLSLVWGYYISWLFIPTVTTPSNRSIELITRQIVACI